MKQRLLSFVAIAALSCVAMAQTWTAPVEPTKPSLWEPTDVTITDGEVYFIRNVGCDQFITGGNDWGTQISVTNDNLPILPITAVASDDYFKLVPVKGTYLFHGTNHGRENHNCSLNGTSQVLFRDNTTSGYVDMGTQNRGFLWNLVKDAESGYYYIHNADYTTYPNSDDEYASVAGAGKPVVFNSTNEAENILWEFIPQQSVDIEKYKADIATYNPAYELFTAKLNLYNTLNDAVKYEVDYAAASEVYNNTASTTEELTAAYETLLSAVNRAIILSMIPESSEDSPLDITQYVLKNPSFEDGMKGWTITEGMGQNLQVQGKHYPENDPEAESFIENFIEAWFPTSVGPLHNGVICQTVTGLPEGRYRIEADVMAVWQGAALSEEPKGIYLYYNNGKFTLHGESLSTGNGVPEHFYFDFDYDGAAEMTIGLMAENTNQNWMGFDNLKLFAIGEVQTPPSFYALLSEVETSEPYNDEGDDLKANADLRSTFQNAFSAAYKLADDQDPTKEKAESYENAYQALHDARVALEASIEDYKNLNTLIERIQNDYDAYEGQSMYADLRTQLNSMMEEYQGGYENGSYTKEQIDAFIAAYDNVLKDYVQALFDNAAKDAAEKGTTLEEPINITSLFDHMSYAYGTTQTGENVYANGYPAENPVWINETKAKNFQTNYSTAQVWNQHPFKISRTFNELPAGRYEIRVHGAYRMAAHDVNYPAYTNGEYAGKDGAFLFAGSKKTPFINMAEITTSAPIVEGNDANVGTDEAPIYVINGQQAAHMLFSDAAYAALAEKCYLAVATNVKNGTLTVGVEGTDQLQDNQWTVWQDFELYYYGAADASALDDEIQALIDEATPLFENGGEGDGAILVEDILNGLDAAIKQGGDALGTEDADTQNAAIQTLEDAIASARENMSVYLELVALYDERNNAINNLSEYTFEDEDYIKMLDEIDACIAEEKFDSHEKMVEYVTRLKDEWFDFLLSVQGMEDASEDDPIDMSLLITNATFDDMTGETTAKPAGWTCEYESNGGKGREGVAEFWNSSTFNIYQELPYLKEGYWRLSVNATFRAGNGDDEVNAVQTGTALTNPEYLYMVINEQEKSKQVAQWIDLEKGAVRILSEGDEGYEENAALIAALTGVDYSYTIGEVTTNFKAPNNQAGFVTFCAKDRYKTSLVFNYVEGDGAVLIGLKTLEKVTNSWCPFDNFQLEYLGIEKPTAVEGLGAKTPASAAISTIYSIDGRQQSQLRRGINIVRTADGKISKVLVK